MKAFLCVDAQNDFMNKDGALAVPGAGEIKPVLKQLSELAKSSNIIVMATMDNHNGDEPEMTKNGGPFPLHCMIGTEGQKQIPEVIIKGQMIFEKKCHNVFDAKLGNKNFVKWLKQNDITEVWVYGVALEYCVLAACLGLKKYVKEVFLFENATRWITEEGKIDALKQLKNAGVHLAKAKL